MTAELQAKLAARISREYFLSEDAAKKQARETVRNCPELLQKNLEQWAAGEPLTEISINGYNNHTDSVSNLHCCGDLCDHQLQYHHSCDCDVCVGIADIGHRPGRCGSDSLSDPEPVQGLQKMANARRRI